MGKEHNKELLKFLKPFSKHNREFALWLRDFVWDRYPDANELIYDNYNALAFGWSLSDRLGNVFCSIAVFEKYLHFGFYYGSLLKDPEKKLLGKGNLYRYLKLAEKSDFPLSYVEILIKEAHANAMNKLKDSKQIIKGQTFVKSISPVKKRPGMAKSRKK